MLQFLRTTSYHWFWRQWRTLVKLVLVSVFLFLPMFSLETAKMMMKVWCAGGMDILPSVFSCSFSVFLWAASLSLLFLPLLLSLFLFPCPLSPVLLFVLSLSILCSSIFLLSLLVPFIYASAEDKCLQLWLRRNKLLLLLACMFSRLRELLMTLLLILTATNAGDRAHRWRKRYSWLRMESCSCKHELALLPYFSQKGTSREGQGWCCCCGAEKFLLN